MDYGQLASVLDEMGLGRDPDQEQARIDALRKQQMIGAMGGVMDVPGVQKMGQLMFQDASRQLNPSSGLDDTLRVLALQNTMANQRENRELRREQGVATAEARRQAAADRQERYDDKRERERYQDAQGVRKRVGEDTYQVISSLGQIRNLVSQYGEGSGEDLDLPGVGRWGSLTPNIFASTEALDLRSALGGLRNKVLAMVSGQAVSESEAARTMQALSMLEGANSEAEMMLALNRLAESTDAILKGQLSLVQPDVREIYGRENPTGVRPVYAEPDPAAGASAAPRPGGGQGTSNW
jgi:hypothetical protein